MNKFLIHALISLGLLLGAFGFGFFLHLYITSVPAAQQETILVALQNEGFFVTQEMILEESVTIDTNTGNALRDFFLGEVVEAEADLRVTFGIDTAELTADDILFEDHQLLVAVPAPTMFSTEIIGDVDIDSKKGVITKITKGEDDYNGLVAIIKEQARTSIEDPDILAAVELGSVESISRFLSIIAPQYTPIVSFKE